MSISSALWQQVIKDADYRCAYCKVPSLITAARLIIDRIFPGFYYDRPAVNT
jgi:hypothetical protein